MNAMASPHICLLKDFIIRLFALIASVAPLSADQIRKLEDSRNAWGALRMRHFSDLLLVTKLVAIGVIIEGFELGYEIFKLIRRWFRNFKPLRLAEPENTDHSPGLIMVIGLVGWLLVCVGVAGEFWVDRWVNTDDSNIQSINVTLLGDAKSSASAAHDLAQSASDIAKPAKETASNALALAHGATIEAVLAKKDLEKVKADVARVEEKYAPRTLSSAQRTSLVTSLRNAPFRPDVPIDVESFIGATDGVSYASEIVDAINDPQTGWHAKYGAQTTSGGNIKGLVLVIHDLPSAPPWAIFLQRALKDAGLGGEGVIFDGQKAGTVMILVAPKN